MKNSAILSVAAMGYLAQAMPNGYEVAEPYGQVVKADCYECTTKQSGKWSDEECEVYWVQNKDHWQPGCEYEFTCKEYHIKHHGGQYPGKGGCTTCVEVEQGRGGKWSDEQCKVWFDKYGQKGEYEVFCKEFHAKYHSGNKGGCTTCIEIEQGRGHGGQWTEEECEVYYNQWKHDLQKNHPEYEAQCKKYGGHHGGGHGGKWSDEECEVYWVQNKDHWQPGCEYEFVCKEYHNKHHGGKYPGQHGGYGGKWSDEECEVYWIQNKDNWQPGCEYEFVCKEYHSKHHGGKYPGKHGDSHGRWADEECEVYWTQHKDNWTPGCEYEFTCKEYHNKHHGGKYPGGGHGGKWSDEECEVYWGQHKDNWTPGCEYEVVCKEYHNKHHGGVYPCTEGCGDVQFKGGNEGQWTELHCKVIFERFYIIGGHGNGTHHNGTHHDEYQGTWDEYKIFCKEYDVKYHHGCAGADTCGDYYSKGGSHGGKWSDAECEAYWGQHKDNWTPGCEYEVVCKEYHSKNHGGVYPCADGCDDYNKGGNKGGKGPQVDCNDSKNLHHEDCVVVISGSSSYTVTVIGGFAAAAFAFAAMF